jgi:hypothetical protein
MLMNSGAQRLNDDDPLEGVGAIIEGVSMAGCRENEDAGRLALWTTPGVASDAQPATTVTTASQMAARTGR